MRILIISVLLLTLASTTAQINDFVNQEKTQKKDFSVKENLDGDPDIAKAMQTIIDKYENSENTQIQTVISRFKELSEKNIYDIELIKANIKSSLDIMLSPNRVDFRPEDLEYIAFCEDMNNTIPGLNLVAILQKVNASDKKPTTTNTTHKRKRISYTSVADDDVKKMQEDSTAVSNVHNDLNGGGDK